MVDKIILFCIFVYIVLIWNKVDNIETILKDIKQYIHNYYYEKKNYK